MKKIRILNIVFDAEIKGYELPAFRGAIIEKVGKENIIFHNHLDDKHFIYKYPLIQYKQINKSPAIFCIDFGVDEIHKFFENKSWDIQLSGRNIEMKIAKLQMNQFIMQVWDKTFNYSIYNWIALNEDNFKKYNLLSGLGEKVTFLENILVGNILSFAKGIEWTLDKQIVLKIKDIIKTKWVTIKEQKVLAFDIDFSCNVFIPNYIGLGKSVSVGYGLVKQIKNFRNEDIQ